MLKNFTRFFFLMIVICFSNKTIAQVLLKEDFETARVPLPPKGWTTPFTGNANWQSLDGNAYEGINCMYLANSYYGDQSDAWLISPKVRLTAGKRYSISFYYKNQVTSRNKLEVTLGDDTTAASQTEVIATTTYNSSLYTKMQINYSATATGIKHLGIHCITKQTYTYAYVDYIVIEEVGCFEPTKPAVDLNSITTSAATASWKAAPGSNFEYGISTDTVPPAATFTTTANTAAVTGLTAATHYYFYVRTVCSPGEYSNWAITDFPTAYETAGIPTINCGEPLNESFRANPGLYNLIFCGQEAYSNEFIHKFIPAASGYYKLNILEVNTGQSVIFSYKDAAEGAGPAGWNCIGGSDGGSKYSFGPLQAGKEYYILEKAVRPVGFPSSFKYTIECFDAPPANDDCSNAVEITSIPYTPNCTGTLLTTVGATSQSLKGGYKICGNFGAGDDDIWIKFKATDDAQLFRFSNMVYSNAYQTNLKPGIYFNIYSRPCDLNSVVDCGLIDIREGKPKEIYSYLLKKDSTYYVQMFTGDFLSYATFNICIMDPGVTNGIANQCMQGLPFTINSDFGNKNIHIWVPLTDANYKRMADINANGNMLNEVNSSVYVNKTSVRSAGGVYYLDRNFTLQSAQAASKKIAVRLYISNAELNKLIAQPGSGVGSVSDLNITQNDDNCTAAFTTTATNFIKQSSSGDYGTDYKYIEFATDHLSSFYLHAGNKPLNAGVIGSAVAADNVIAKNSNTGVYPNPFTSSFTLSVNEKQTTKLAVSVLDMKGNTVKVISKTVDAGFTQIHIEAANLAPGLYTLKIQKNSTVEYIKVIRQ